MQRMFAPQPSPLIYPNFCYWHTQNWNAAGTFGFLLQVPCFPLSRCVRVEQSSTLEQGGFRYITQKEHQRGCSCKIDQVRHRPQVRGEPINFSIRFRKEYTDYARSPSNRHKKNLSGQKSKSDRQRIVEDGRSEIQLQIPTCSTIHQASICRKTGHATEEMNL